MTSHRPRDGRAPPEQIAAGQRISRFPTRRPAWSSRAGRWPSSSPRSPSGAWSTGLDMSTTRPWNGSGPLFSICSRP